MRSYGHSVVMLDNHTADDLLFNAFLFAHLQFGRTISDAPALPPLLHGRRKIILDEPGDADTFENRAFGIRNELHIIIGHGEIKGA